MEITNFLINIDVETMQMFSNLTVNNQDTIYLL